VCLLLTVTGAVVTAAILSTAPATGASVGTFAAGVGLDAAWTTRGPRAPKAVTTAPTHSRKPPLFRQHKTKALPRTGVMAYSTVANSAELRRLGLSGC
jgi:hypothetical protein